MLCHVIPLGFFAENNSQRIKIYKSMSAWALLIQRSDNRTNWGFLGSTLKRFCYCVPYFKRDLKFICLGFNQPKLDSAAVFSFGLVFFLFLLQNF